MKKPYSLFLSVNCRLVLLSGFIALFLSLPLTSLAQEDAAAEPVAPAQTQEQAATAMDIAREAVLELKGSIRHCAAISSRVDRLICYDELSKSLGYVPTDKAEREEEVLERYGFWEVTKRRTAAGEEIIYLKNNAIEEVVSRSGLRRKPSLVIKCSRGNTNVYVDWKAKLATQYYSGIAQMPITYQYDATEALSEKWELSTDGHALFAPKPVEMVREMRQRNRIVFKLTPANDVTQTIVHDISGLNSVIDLLIDECYYGHLKQQDQPQ